METSRTPERSKPTVPPKPAILFHSLTSATISEISRSNGGDASQNQCSQNSPANRNIDSPKISGSSKPALLPKPEHLKNFRSPVHSNQASPMIPKKPVNLNSPCISSGIKDSETVISRDTFKLGKNPTSEISFEDAVEPSKHSSESRSDVDVTTTVSSSREESHSVKLHVVRSLVEGADSQPRVTETTMSYEIKQSDKMNHCVINMSHSSLEETSHPNLEKLEITSPNHESNNFDTQSNSLKSVNEELSGAPMLSTNFSALTSSQTLNEDLEENSTESIKQEEYSLTDGIYCISPPSNASFQLVLNDVPVDHEKHKSESSLSLSTPKIKEDVSSVMSQHSGSVPDINTSNCSKASQSDVESVGSDTGRSNSKRGTLKTWFGSFGKGAKNRKKRQSIILYSDDGNEENCDSTVHQTDDSLSQSDDSSARVGESYETDKLCVPVISSGDQIEGSRSSMSEESLENELMSISSVEKGADDEPEEDNSKKKKVRKAYLVAKELFTSEKVFIDALSLICNDFTAFINNVSPDSSTPVLPQADLQKVIGSLPQLLLFNQVLLQDFENRISSWESHPKISDVIVKKGPFLKLYTSYINDFQSQCEFLDDCCQKYPRFAKALKEFESSDVCKKLSLKHYMLKPVQRLPQYRLLLADYLSNLDIDSEDYKDTQEALRVVCDVASHANKSMNQGDRLSKLLQIQAQLGNHEIVKPGREFIKEGELYKLSRKSLQPRFLILLNDTLILTSDYGSMTGPKVNQELPLSGMKVCVPQTEDYDNEFSIITTTRSFSLRARTQTERKEWVEALESAINENIRRQLSFMKTVPKSVTQIEFAIGKEAPVWIPDDRVTRCQSCTAVFTVTFRRHHCRACGKVVCSHCSIYRAPLQYMKFQARRVCEGCYSILIKEFEDQSNQLYEAIKKEFNLNSHGAVISALTDTFHLFKKTNLGDWKLKTDLEIPPRLRVTAYDPSCQINGFLSYQKKKCSWKRLWFVLKDQVLFYFKASEDVAALGSIVVLGYRVENVNKDLEVSDTKRVFQLVHPGQKPIIFCADNRDIAERWMKKLNEATVLG